MQDGAEILELSDGSSLISAHLAGKGYKTTVADLNGTIVKRSKEDYQENGTVEKLRVFDKIESPNTIVRKYDVVFTIGILDHFDGQKVVKILEKMMELGQYVIVLSQNPKCMSCLLYNKVAKEKGDLQELSIFRQSFAELAELAGLDVVKETFFSAPSLSKWMASMISPETGKTYADSIEHNLIPSDQQHFKVLIAKKAAMEIEAHEKIALYKRVFESEIEAFKRSCDRDIYTLNERISNLEDELVTRINSIRQLELVQQYGNTMIKTPMGLLLSVYYQRADLQEAFPEVVNHDYRRLLQWAKEIVGGNTSDFSINKLREFREWYVLAGETWFTNDIERVVNNPIGLLLSLYHQRPDLQQAFPEVKNSDYSKLIRWAAIDGISHDSNSDKLQRFAEWYRGAISLTEILDSEKSDPLSVVLSLYIMRRDLQRAFPEVVNHDYRRLLQWAKETVDGKTGDSDTEVLKRFAEWYRKVGDNPQQAQVSIPAFGTITTYLELLRNLKLDRHVRTSN